MTETQNTPEKDGQVADAIQGNWVDNWAPEWSRPFLQLSRADRPIGTWLLLLPCWWGALLAAAHFDRFGLHEVWILVACAIGAGLMRGAGCTWNDITDRNYDAQVERTRSRPLPSGRVSVTGAVIWMGVQALLAFLVLLTFNATAILLGVASLALIAIYPFAKRFTWWPQAFLGLAFNWGALLAWVAVTGSLDWPALFLYAAGISWTLFYDTIYAHQDKDDDALIGIKSTARLFGDATRIWLRWFMIATVVLMAAAIIIALIPRQGALSMVVALGAPWSLGWHLAWQNRSLVADDPENCSHLFKSNRNAGLLPALFIAAAVFL